MVLLLHLLWDGTHIMSIRQSLPLFIFPTIDLDCRCNTNEDQYRTAAQALVDSGLRDLGYKYFNLCVRISKPCVLPY